MPDREKLQQQADIVREQLENHPELPAEKRQALEELIAKFEVSWKWNRPPKRPASLTM